MPKRKMLELEDDLGSDYLYPGALIPHGRCPKKDCGAGCFPLVLELANLKVLGAIYAMWDALSNIVEEPLMGDRYDAEAFHKAGVKAIAKMQRALPTYLHEETKGSHAEESRQTVPNHQGQSLCGPR
ncbi:MAG: hypothetical protein ABIQ41_08070 [Gemmatimonadales bacterium]